MSVQFDDEYTAHSSGQQRPPVGATSSMFTSPPSILPTSSNTTRVVDNIGPNEVSQSIDLLPMVGITITIGLLMYAAIPNNNQAWLQLSKSDNSFAVESASISLSIQPFALCVAAKLSGAVNVDKVECVSISSSCTATDPSLAALFQLVGSNVPEIQLHDCGVFNGWRGTLVLGIILLIIALGIHLASGCCNCGAGGKSATIVTITIALLCHMASAGLFLLYHYHTLASEYSIKTFGIIGLACWGALLLITGFIFFQRPLQTPPRRIVTTTVTQNAPPYYPLQPLHQPLLQ